jgi:hypothetical protein
VSNSIHDYNGVCFSDPEISCQYGQQEGEIRIWPHDVGQGFIFSNADQLHNSLKGLVCVFMVILDYQYLHFHGESLVVLYPPSVVVADKLISAFSAFEG